MAFTEIDAFLSCLSFLHKNNMQVLFVNAILLLFWTVYGDDKRNKEKEIQGVLVVDVQREPYRLVVAGAKKP